MRPQLIARALALLLVVVPVGLAAQLPEPEPPPVDAPPPITLLFIEGRVDLVRTSGVQPAQAPELLDEDDCVVTGDGRAELVYADGSVAHLDRHTDVRVDLGVRLRLVRGRIVVHTPRDGDRLELVIPAGVVRLEPDGEYDLAAADLEGDSVVAVVRGRAVLEHDDQAVPVAADDELRLDPRDRRPRWARVAPPDVFRDWSRARVPTTTQVTSGYALPAPLAPYAQQFATYGEWSNVAPYGPVWFPSARAGWRPYSNGSWRYTRYGWTWIDSDPWAWPVHHFGRWGRHDVSGWYWIPQRTWGPAWVGWAMGADHVAWSPLGWDRRPVVDFFAGARLGPIDVWASSWSVVPRRHFGHRLPVARYLEDPRRLPGPVLGGFVSQMIGPRGPVGGDVRFRGRGGREAWRSPARPNPGGEVPGGRERSPYPRRDRPESFGSATPSRPVAQGAPSRPRAGVDSGPLDQTRRSRTVGGEVDRRDDAGRPGGRRPGDARALDGTTSPPDIFPAPGYRDRTAGGSRGPNSIRPRYERPEPGANYPPPAGNAPAAPGGSPGPGHALTAHRAPGAPMTAAADGALQEPRGIAATAPARRPAPAPLVPTTRAGAVMTRAHLALLPAPAAAVAPAPPAAAAATATAAAKAAPSVAATAATVAAGPRPSRAASRRVATAGAAVQAEFYVD